MPLKGIFQKVCELKIDWDDELPTEISNEWHKLINDIANNSSIEFQRSLLGDIDINTSSPFNYTDFLMQAKKRSELVFISESKQQAKLKSV